MTLLFALSGTLAIPACGEKNQAPSREEICEKYAAKVIECEPEYAQQQVLFEAYCEYYLAYYTSQYGEACGEAMEEFFTCLTGLTCAQIEGNASPCASQEAAWEASCAGADSGDAPVVTGGDSFTETGGMDSATDTGMPNDTGTTG